MTEPPFIIRYARQLAAIMPERVDMAEAHANDSIKTGSRTRGSREPGSDKKTTDDE
jgi:hypothetical protein